MNSSLSSLRAARVLRGERFWDRMRCSRPITGAVAMEPGTEGFCTIEEALEELRQGRMIVLVDDEHRENEGDLVVAAEKATPEAINFMMRNACGMLCLAMSPAICDRLHLDTVPGANVDAAGHAVDAEHRRPHRHHHRHLGLRPRPHRPGRHRRPHHAGRPGPRQGPRARPARREGGVLVRAGHTEGSVDLARLAGLKEAAVICEIVNPDGTHGPPARPARLLRAARPEDVYHRGPHQVPPPARAADPPRD